MPISGRGRIAIAVGVLVALGAVALFLRSRSSGSVDSAAALRLALSQPRPGATPRSPPSPPPPASLPSASALASTLHDSSWQARLAAVNALRDRSDIPAPQRTELLLAALSREIAQPTESLPFPGSYLPSASIFRLQILRVLEGLGPDGVPVARQAAEGASGETREWILLAQAGVGDLQSSLPLGQLLRTSQDGTVRMTAARLLGRLGDRAAVPGLKAALQDPFTATTADDDTDVPPHSFYPVREQAAGALKALGVRVDRNGDTFTAH
jgi:HEAT repeat protein